VQKLKNQETQFISYFYIMAAMQSGDKTFTATYCLTLKLEALCPSKTLVAMQQLTWHNLMKT
jgi:hypothetical protein